jgi:long-chain acyl-CoA synthetase
MFVDIAAMLYGLTVVPLYDTLGPESITHCLNNSGCYNMFASSNSVDVLLKTEDLGNLKTIIAFDKITEE